MSLQSTFEGVWMDVCYLGKGLDNEQSQLVLEGLGVLKSEIVRLRELVSELNNEISSKEKRITELEDEIEEMT